MRRAPLQPLDVVLRHARGYQWVRRSFLAFSVALTVGLPFWHLHALRLASAGRAGAATPLPGPLSVFDREPPFSGAPTSIDISLFELVDPLESTAVALFRGVSWSWLWMVLPGVLLVVTFGRFFCGWACPYLPILAASNACRWFLARLGVPIRDVQLPRVTNRVVLLLTLVVGGVLGVQLVPLVYPPAIIGREAFRAIFTGSVGLGALFVVGAFLFDTFVSRAGFCRSLCPGGAMFSWLANASPIQVKNERSKCTDCTACDVVCNLGQSPMNNRLDAGCERCGKCIASCPTGALSWTVGPPPLVQLGLPGNRAEDRS